MVRRTWIEFVDGLGSNECKGLDYRDDGVVASTNRLLIMQVVRTSTSMTSTAALREDDDEPRAESDTLRGLLLQSLRQLSHLLADNQVIERGFGSQEIVEDKVAVTQVIKYTVKESADLNRSASELTSEGFRERRFVHLVWKRMRGGVRVDKALLRSRVSAKVQS